MYDRIEKFARNLVVTMMVGLVVPLAYAQEKPASDSNAEPGFVHIFNGKDLSGWDSDPRLWSVQDGAIRGQTTQENRAKSNTFCIWRGGKLKNFVLKIKFRIENGNSGIQYRSRDLSNWSVGGYQAEVCNQQGKVGFLYDERGRGWMARVGEFMVVDKKGKKHVVSKVADSNALIKAGYYREKEWNEYAIIARGNHLVHILNGFQTIEMIDNDPKGRAMEGILALQIHTGPPMTVYFKDIRIKRLPDHFGKAGLLFNGKDLDGWTFSSDELKDTWSVEDGVMVNSGKPAGYIRTKEDYANYVLMLRFRHVTKGNSGVLLRAVGEDKVWPRSVEAQGQYGHVGDIWNIGKFPMRTDQERTKGRRTLKMHESNEKALGEWNQYEISFDGPDLEIKVNDLVQNTASECWETPGKICIQSEGAQMEYRNIVLIPIIRDKKVTLEIISTQFQNGQYIPVMYTGEGENISPPLSWQGTPAGTRSYAVIADDPDAPRRTWVHWVIYNIPANSAGLPEAVPVADSLPDGSRQGRNDFGRGGYGGPMPPRGPEHRYFFKLYALDCVLDLGPRVTKAELLKAMQGHVLAEARLVGLYKR